MADLAFGFGADFFKFGITGKEREVKIKRLIEIEKNLRWNIKNALIQKFMGLEY